MKKVTFTKAFTVVVDAMTKLTYPEGWSGNVEDDIADAAAKEGCIEGKPKAKGKAEDAAETPPA